MHVIVRADLRRIQTYQRQPGSTTQFDFAPLPQPAGGQ